MEILQTALILEGGGMRGVYTTGVLNYFLEQQIYFPYVIGVSMGACNAANYISRQPERNKRVNMDYVNDTRYLSYKRLLTHGELFGMDFIFKTIPDALDLFDYKTFYENPAKCLTTVTDCVTGEALYYEKNELGPDYMTVLRASSSLPFISKPVPFRRRMLMDGGMSDSIPIRKSITDGNARHVIVLTQPAQYRKKKESLAGLAKYRYPHFPGLIKALNDRHNAYNETLDYIESLASQGNVYVIRPKETLNAGRIERDKRLLELVYKRGYEDARFHYKELSGFLR